MENSKGLRNKVKVKGEAGVIFCCLELRPAEPGEAEIEERKGERLILLMCLERY